MIQTTTELACPPKAIKRMEKSILRANLHPALLHPWYYNIDLVRQSIAMLILTGLVLVIWQYMSHLPRAIAPSSDIHVQLVQADAR